MKALNMEGLQNVRMNKRLYATKFENSKEGILKHMEARFLKMEIYVEGYVITAVDLNAKTVLSILPM